MKAAFPRGARAFRSERWLVKLATTIPCSGGSPLHLAPRVWGRRAGCAVVLVFGVSRGHETRRLPGGGRSGRARLGIRLVPRALVSAGFDQRPPRRLTRGLCYRRVLAVFVVRGEARVLHRGLSRHGITTTQKEVGAASSLRVLRLWTRSNSRTQRQGGSHPYGAWHMLALRPRSQAITRRCPRAPTR